MTKNQILIILNKKDPTLKLECLVNKKCGSFSFNKFSFSEDKKVENFYSQVYSLSRNKNANVALMDEKDKNFIKMEFYSIPEVRPSNLYQLVEGRIKSDYVSNKFLLVEGHKLL